MRWLHQVLFRLRPFRSRRGVQNEIDEELRFHIDMETEKHIRRGLDPAEARREAYRKFGGVERFKEEVREVDGVSVFERIRSDLRFGVRVLLKNPVFACVAVFTLALGIGASTAIFSVVDGILLKPLPFAQPDRLVTYWADYTRRGGPVREWLSYPDFHDARQRGDVFDELALYNTGGLTLTGQGEAEMVQATLVTHGMLSRVLDVEPVLGRGLTAQDDRPGAPAVVLLSHGLWERRFGSDPAVVGRTLVLNDEPATVIGIMPARFRQPYAEATELWTPLRWDEVDHGGGRGSAIVRAIGRLAPGVSVEAAQAEASRLATRLEEAFPDTNTGVGFAVFPLQDDMVSEASTALWVLLGAVGFVLLIVCVNLANLLLARGTSREGELAVRAALGAGRGRIVGQLLTESVLLAALGGLLGIVVAYLGTGLLVAIAPDGVPRIHDVAVDARVLAFAAAATLASGVFFGLVPAVRGARTNLRDSLHEAGRSVDRKGGLRSLRSGLVALQVGLAMVLLVGAGLLLRSFQELSRVDLGFDPAGVTTFTVFLPPARYEGRDAIIGYVQELERRLASLPGVTGVGAVNSLPLSGNDGDSGFMIEGRPLPPPGQHNAAWMRRATAGYFPTMNLRMAQGRPFDARDEAEAAPVIIVNETLAARYFGDQDPVGQRINVNNPEEPIWREIVGVARDVRNFGIRAEGRSAIYFPFSQLPRRFMTLTVRTSGDPASLTGPIRSEVAALDPTIPITVTSMDAIVQGSLEADRFVTTLLSLFAGVALLLAAVGLYGVVSYGVNRRMREMGVRVALGAHGNDISRLVVGRSLALTAGGVALGLLGAVGVTRLMSGLLFGVSPTDPVTFLGMALVLAAVAAAASAVPAWRAARVDPVRVLRAE
jgi:putative ABC transport system permease protein